ncbi:MAG: hypothetical protein ACKO5E_05855, partial [bacterium]
KSIDIQINNLIYNEIIENAMKLINDAISYNQLIAFTGLEYLTFESQKLAIEMARRINAWIISNEKGTSADPWDIAFSQLGGWHASWSEIRLRSDSILLWYAPLWDTHPRWVERFGPRLHNAHRLAVIDPGVELIDNLWFEEQVIRLNSEGSIAFLTDLRLALKNKSDNHPNGDIRHLIHHFNNSHWLSIVKSEDPPLISDKLAYANTMIRLVMESNRLDHRVVLNSVSRAPNTQGMSAIQSWRAGLHMPIWFSPEGPVFRPDELKLDEFDLMISFGFNKPLSFRGKLIWMNPQGNEINQFDDFIEMPVSNIGLDSGGTLIRQDGVAIYAGKSRESSRLNVSDFITSFLNSVIAEPNFRSRRS